MHHDDTTFVTSSSKVIQRGKRKKKFLWFYALWFVFVVAVISFMNTWQQIHVLKCGYQLQKLQTLHRELSDLRESLLMSRNQLRSLPRVENIARSKLGMIPADPQNCVFLIKTQKRYTTYRYVAEKK